MSARLVVGTQWGDEGKAKFIDYFSNDIDIIVRYQGGANAGHTVEVGGEKYVFHLVPSGVLYPDTVCVLGNGVVLDPKAFVEELDYLKERGIDAERRIVLSDACHIVLPHHQMIDAAREQQAGAGKIGTTKRGIGVCYGDKVTRIGLRMGDLLNETRLRDRLEQLLDAKNRELRDVHGMEEVRVDDVFDWLRDFGDRTRDLVRNTSLYLNRELAAGKMVLLEGAQGTALDIDFGTYPYVTSSNTTTGGALAGSGIGFQFLKESIGICKAYVTRVGEGPFPTEVHDAEGELMRKRGNEFGATTGRPRRCGWFDVELLRHAARVNGLTGLALTKIDVLAGYDEIRIGVGYKRDGERLDAFPTDGRFEGLEVEYETMAGWKSDITKARKLSDLPAPCRLYIDRLVELTRVPVQFISVGPGRDDTIVC